MSTRFFSLIVAASVVVVALTSAFLTLPRAEAQGVSSQVITNYLDRMGVTWRRQSSDPNAFIVTKTTGLSRADRVELIVTNLAKDDLVTLRAYPQVGGKYLALSGSGDQRGLTKAMLEKNSMAFGAYFIDEDGDIGFRYVFTTESGLGFEAFKVAVTELLRIADDAAVSLYNRYR